jgi:hypothetical protein
MQALAAVLSDGRVALAESCEEDLWEETAEEAEGALPESGAGEPCLPATALSGGLPAGVSGRQAAWLDEERLLVVGTACRAEGAALAGSGDACGDCLIEVRRRDGWLSGFGGWPAGVLHAKADARRFPPLFRLSLSC